MSEKPAKEPEADKPPAEPKPVRRPKPLAFGSKIRRVSRIHIPGSGYW